MIRIAPTAGGRGLGFFEIAAGISTLIATGAGAAVNIYGTIEQLKLAEEASELQNELARRRFALEEQLSQAQQRIFAIQAEGIEARQDIDLQIAQMQSEVLAQQLEQVKRQQQLQAEITELRLQRELEMEQEQFRQQQAIYRQFAVQSNAGESRELEVEQEQFRQQQAMQFSVQSNAGESMIEQASGDERGSSGIGIFVYAVPAAFLIWFLARK